MSDPRKYLDVERTVVNPQWLADQAALRAAAALNEDGQTVYEPLHSFQELERYLPETVGKRVAEDGSWVIVTREPHTELKDRFRVPPLSMWRARRQAGSRSITARLELDGRRRSVRLRAEQAVISTPGGNLGLWPHEYVMASDPVSLACDPDSTINSLSGEPPVDPERLWYLMSRGIPYDQALRLLFDQITGFDRCYVTFPEDVVTAFTR